MFLLTAFRNDTTTFGPSMASTAGFYPRSAESDPPNPLRDCTLKDLDLGKVVVILLVGYPGTRFVYPDLRRRLEQRFQ